MTADITDRKAAMLARRAAWAPTEELTVSVADLRIGDHVIVIPTQHNVRGVRVGANVTSLADDDTTWIERAAYRSRTTYPVDARRIDFGSIDTNLVVPIHFTVKIRRTVAA